MLLASENGFEILDKKEFNDSVPKISTNLNNLIAEFTSRAQDDDIPMSTFLEELKEYIRVNNISSSTNQKLKAGTGVDVWLKKDEIEYMFDIKTVKPNRVHLILFSTIDLLECPQGSSRYKYKIKNCNCISI